LAIGLEDNTSEITDQTGLGLPVGENGRSDSVGVLQLEEVRDGVPHVELQVTNVGRVNHVEAGNILHEDGWDDSLVRLVEQVSLLLLDLESISLGS